MSEKLNSYIYYSSQGIYASLKKNIRKGIQPRKISSQRKLCRKTTAFPFTFHKTVKLPKEISKHLESETGHFQKIGKILPLW